MQIGAVQNIILNRRECIVKVNLTECTERMNALRQRREELHYTGREDLDCLNKMKAIRHSVTEELSEVRAQIQVCPLRMLGSLKQREKELLEWKFENT